MEYIDPPHLESYERILKQIKEEHIEATKLEQRIKEAEDEIIALKIAQSKDKFQKQLCDTNVKIFNNVFDIHNLYKEELQLQDLMSLAKQAGQKYYLVEICMSKLLVEKVSGNWKLLINIRNQSFDVNRVMKLNDKTPLIEVIPVDERVIDCQLNVKLFRQTEQNCMTIPLSKTDIDVSYHFEAYKEGNNVTTCYEKWIGMTKMYNKSDNVENILKPVYFEYKINGNLSPQDFMKQLLRNSYHRLDIELLSELSSSSGKSVNVTFTFRNHNRCIIKYDPVAKSVKLKCTAEDLFILKEYILRNIPATNYNTAIPDDTSKETSRRLSEDAQSFEELKKLYEDHRHIMHQTIL